MECPKCKAVNEKGSMFCNKCGNILTSSNTVNNVTEDTSLQKKIHEESSGTTTKEVNSNLSTNAFGIVSLVVSILAIITSIIPIVNNASPFIAIVGIILWIPAFFSIKKGKTKGKSLITVALILNIVAIALTLVCQAACSSVLKEATGGSATPTTQSATTNNKTEYSIGENLELSNGLKVSVDSVTPGFSDYSGSPLTKVIVTYNNDGKDEKSFNTYDWKAEDPNGAATSGTYYSKGDSSAQLNSGKLAAGGKKTGELYFKGTVAKVVYNPSFISDKNYKWLVN